MALLRAVALVERVNLSMHSRVATDFAVIGGGIVGACCAAFLQREGFSVTLIDRDEPGRGCSYGNAGNFSIGTVTPYAMPGTAWRVPKMLRDPLHPLHIDWRHSPAALPYFIRFLMNSRERHVEQIASALHSILSRVFESYEMLLGPVRMNDLIKRNGKIFTYESEEVCVPKTLSALMTQWNRLSWRNDRATLFCSGGPGLAIQVEVAA